MTKVERDDAPPVARGRRRQAEREKDERDAEEDHRAHSREPVGGVEEDLGEPLLVGPGSPVSEDRQVLRVGKPVIDDLPAGHQGQPGIADDDRRGEDGEEHDSDQGDEQDREGARLEDAAETTFRAGVRLRSDAFGPGAA